MLNITELKVLEQIAKNNRNIKQIAQAISKTDKQIYRSLQKLRRKGFICVKTEPSKNTFTNLILNLLKQYPNLIPLLANAGLKILMSLTTPKKIQEIQKETGLKKSSIYNKIKDAMKVSIVVVQNKKYSINEKIWKVLKEFIQSYKQYEETIDQRVDAGSKIYFKSENEIVYSSVKVQDAVKTAFSAYEKQGIKILLPEEYYYLPKRKLTIKQIFIHSLYVVKKEPSIRNIIFVTLFYVKHKKKLSRVKHEIINDLKKVLKGRDIEGYPSLNEIKEKGEIYDIAI